jgi:hypothetical protein
MGIPRRESANLRASSCLRSQSSKLFGKKFDQKSQSAMEYLMTYGWSILIIGVVLAVLFSLGIFNPSSYAPKAQPGSCQVYRPGGGPGSTSFINLEGTSCGGELPRFVAQFNGASSYVQVADAPPLRVGNPYLTFSAWIDPASLSSCGYVSCIIFNKEDSYEWALSSTGQLCWAIDNSNPGWVWKCTNIYLGVNTYFQVTITYDGANVNAYLNGAENTATSATGSVTDYQNPLRIGARGGPGSFFDGSIADVQIYNASLSPAGVNALYAEGIGGAPIQLQNLVGWWPLNGDSNDYSGNGNNGAATGVIYTSQWSSGYTAPP